MSASPPTALQKRVQEAQGPVDLAAISNIPITLKLTEDTKVIYETVGKLAGINVLFDPDYTSRRVKIELNGVTLQEALEIIALESKTFWRPVTPNTIFVASDNPSKRKEVEQSVIKTFYLANLSQPTELQDVVNALRQILEISRIQPLPSQGALVVRGTPDQIALAEKLVGFLAESVFCAFAPSGRLAARATVKSKTDFFILFSPPWQEPRFAELKLKKRGVEWPRFESILTPLAVARQTQNLRITYRQFALLITGRQSRSSV